MSKDIKVNSSSRFGREAEGDVDEENNLNSEEK